MAGVGVKLKYLANATPRLSRGRPSLGARRSAAHRRRASSAGAADGVSNRWGLGVDTLRSAEASVDEVISPRQKPRGPGPQPPVEPAEAKVDWGMTLLCCLGPSLLGGSWADQVGGKIVLASGVIAWSSFTFLTPDAAMAGAVTLLACRVAMGLGEGVAFPAVHSIISKSVPLGYQSTAVAVVTAASYAGAAFAAGVSPWLINKYDWPAVFYVFGASAILWLPFWLATSFPESSRPLKPLPPAASSSSGALNVADRQLEDDEEVLLQTAPADSPKAPTRLLGLGPGFWALTQRREVWAICVAQYCQSWGMYALLNWLPTYFEQVQGVDISDLGQYTLVPPLAQAVVGGFSGVVADRLLVNGWSVRGTRRSLQVAGMLGPAACLILAVSPVAEGSPATASALLTVAQGLSALTLGAVSVSQLDIAPKHAGSIFGLGNTFATAAGSISVQATGSILQATGSWPLVFAVTSAHYVAGAAFWYAWCGGERLPEDEFD